MNVRKQRKLKSYRSAIRGNNIKLIMSIINDIHSKHFPEMMPATVGESARRAKEFMKSILCGEDWVRSVRKGYIDAYKNSR